MAARTRRVVWTESAQEAVDEVISYISRDSRDNAVGVLTRALDTAASLSTFAERGRMVKEFGEVDLA